MMRIRLMMLAGLLLTALCAFAADPPKAEPIPGRVLLPQEHQYQRVLRAYMATLTEKDFAHGVTEKLTIAPVNPDLEYQYRMFMMSRMEQPLVGFKRGIPAVKAPAWLFLLSTIEGPTTVPSREEAIAGFEARKTSATIRPGPISTPTGIVIPPVWPETLVAFTEWDYPGNVFSNKRELKMRAFVTAAVRMIMLDNHFGDLDKPGRSDWNAYQLVTFSDTYLGVKDLLPAEVRQAYEEGLRRFAGRIVRWGIKGEEPNMDMTAPVALWYAARALNDPGVMGEAEAYAHRMMADPRHFHPAGYWVERGGGLDVGFGGMATFFSTWLALASEWPFAKEHVERAYRLRAHLALPEPDGIVTGPSHFNSRIGTSAWDDEWHWDGARDLTASMVTDEAAYAVKAPTPEQLSEAAGKRAGWFNQQIYGNLRNPYNPYRSEAGNYGYVQDEDLRGSTWRWRLWDTFNFPATINPAYAFYRPGAYAHRVKLEQEDSPLLKLPYLRGETFLRNFADAFVTTRQAGYAAILHTGPVGEQNPKDGLVQMPGPMGFGGGQLSAFWTPATGAVILGRRSGMNAGKNHDATENWRQWPIHAISGCTADGKVFTSARIIQPEVVTDLKADRGTVTVSSVIPAAQLDQGPVLAGRLDYRRTFRVEPDAVRVETRVTGDGKDNIAELYETLPVFLRDTKNQAKATPTAIEFQAGGKWMPATDEYQDKVTAIKLTRFDGAVEITFDRPQRVKLSPANWTDTYITRASCRTILIDLLNGGALAGEKMVSYRISAVTK